MRSLFTLLGLLLLQTILLIGQSLAANGFTPPFALKEGPNVFSPRTLVELGRPGNGVANRAGDLVFVPHSKFSLDEKTNNKSIFIASLEKSIKPLEIALPDGGEAFWLDHRSIGHAVDTGKGVLDLYALNINFESNLTASDPVYIGSFPTKTATKFQYSNGTLVFVDYVYPDGNLTSAKERDEKRVPNAPMVFDQLNERFWDSWLSPKSASLFSFDLQSGPDKAWKMGSTFTNLLQGTRHTSDEFSFVGGYVLYTSVDPKLSSPLLHSRRNVHLVKTTDPGNPVQLTTGRQGSTGSPVLNSDATKAAWIQQEDDAKMRIGLDKIILFDLITKGRRALASKWDRFPESLTFSHAGDVIYLTAEDHARIKVYALPILPTWPPTANIPVPLTHRGAASGLQALPHGRLLFSQSSFTSPADVYLLQDLKSFEADRHASQAPFKIQPAPKLQQITHFSAEALESKNLDEGEEFWFKGALGKDVQGWVFKPKGWNENDNKKWPVVMVIHGGPHSSHADQWSTRWNPNVFAQQGYFSIWMNPTGSTGFGAQFAQGIVEDWGGKPFVDMVHGFKSVLKSYPQIDPDRAAAAGASWGGYAINWIQGHPEYGFNFKALVCHDGVFSSSYSSYASDAPRLFNHEFGGAPWEKNVHGEFDPANFVDRWSTPQLVIHGSKDYRLPETESIGAFHALQQLQIPSRLLIFPDENHWVLGHEHSLKWHYEVFKWFDEFVGAN